MIDFDILSPNTPGASSGTSPFGFDILGPTPGQGLLQALGPTPGAPNGQGQNGPVFNSTPLAGQPQQAPMNGLLAGLFGTPANVGPVPGAAPQGAQPQNNQFASAVGTSLRNLLDGAIGVQR